MIMQSDHGTRLRTWLAAHPDGAWAAAVAAIGCLIYLPWLGSYPLWDPWEPHYSQVAWEMQERLTWFNPWYRGIDNWWSKPILMLWMLRASLGLFWDPIADFANNELAARIPFAVVAIAGDVSAAEAIRECREYLESIPRRPPPPRPRSPEALMSSTTLSGAISPSTCDSAA